MGYTNFTPKTRIQEAQDGKSFKIWDESIWNGESAYTTTCFVTVFFIGNDEEIIEFSPYELITGVDKTKFNEYLSTEGHIINVADFGIAERFIDGYYVIRVTYDGFVPIISGIIHSTDANAAPLYTFGYGRFTPIYYYNDKTYHVWMDKGDSRAHIWSYDHIAKTESANYDLHSVSEPAGDGDVHPMPSVIVADDGHIVVAQEFIRVAPATHNDAITIKRSDNVEDVTSWVNAKAENANYWTYIGSWQPDNSQRLAYPILHKDTSGNLYVISRRYESGGEFNTIHKSIDHGVSWDAGHDIVDSNSVAIWMTPSAIIGGTSDVLRYMIGRSTSYGTISDRVYYLESADEGVTWRDISRGFTKDTVASGAITLAELEDAGNDFIVASPAIVGEDRTSCKTGTFDDNGNVYIITTEWDSLAAHFDYRVFYWDGNSWENSILKNLVNFNTNPVLIHIGGTIFDCYLEDIANQMSLYRTIDLLTWTKVRDVKLTTGLTVNTFLINNFTNNYKDAEYTMFVGVYGTDAAYSDIFAEINYAETSELQYYDNNHAFLAKYKCMSRKLATILSCH